VALLLFMRGLNTWCSAHAMPQMTGEGAPSQGSGWQEVHALHAAHLDIERQDVDEWPVQGWYRYDMMDGWNALKN